MNNKIEDTTEIFDKTIIVAAHPDDEVLWFSSILAGVDDVIICFMGEKTRPNRQLNRHKSLSEHPIKKISCLNIYQSDTFYGVNWTNPMITKYGIEIADIKYSDKTYKENYYELRERLKVKLTGRHNVFTHNPWGEYGNQEHVQVYRVIKDLQESMNFNLWFSNYVSNKSFKLMVDCIHQSDPEYITLKTNKVLAHTIKSIYMKNNCWTWDDDWEWLNEESFIRDKTFEKKSEGYGCVPINLMKVLLPSGSKSKFQFENHLFPGIFDSKILNKLKQKISFNNKKF